jgi:hypothetical protein
VRGGARAAGAEERGAAGGGGVGRGGTGARRGRGGTARQLGDGVVSLAHEGLELVDALERERLDDLTAGRLLDAHADEELAHGVGADLVKLVDDDAHVRELVGVDAELGEDRREDAPAVDLDAHVLRGDADGAEKVDDGGEELDLGGHALLACGRRARARGHEGRGECGGRRRRRPRCGPAAGGRAAAGGRRCAGLVPGRRIARAPMMSMFHW